MELCYDGALVMPKNCIAVTEDEMTYLESGWCGTGTHTIKEGRSLMWGMVALTTTGTIASGILTALAIPSVIGAVVAAAGTVLFGNAAIQAGAAYHQLCLMGSSGNCSITISGVLLAITGITVKKI